MFEQLLGPGHEAVNALLGPMPAKKAPSAGAMAAPTSYSPTSPAEMGMFLR